MTIKSYLAKESWRINENASTGYSIGGLNGQTTAKETSHYWLSEVYTEEIAEAHRSAKIHIHDLCMLTGYCNGWSLRQLISEGLGGVPNKVSSAPAKHLYTVCQHIINFFGVMANESAGAQAFSSLDTYLAPFVREDGLTYSEVKQAIQTLVFGMNTESRWSGQAPFTNFTFDIKVPDDLADKSCYFNGGVTDYTYSELQGEMNMINKAFVEVMTAGDADGRGFPYPIPTYNITKSFDFDGEIESKVFEMAAKYGIPYFQNFVNSDLKPDDVRSMCCRLQLDKRELRKRGGGLFGADEFTGSIGVVTINMPNVALCTDSEESFIDEVVRRMGIARDSLELKRSFISFHLEDGLYPYTRRYLTMGYKNHFSTIGLCGMNEACMNLFGEDISTERSHAFTLRVMDAMRSECVRFQEETGNLYNLEASPAEGTSYRFAKHDLANFGHHIAHGGTIKNCYYTNSTNLPVGKTSNMFEALDHQEQIQVRYTGGTVSHLYIGEEITSHAAKAVIRAAFNKYKIPYISITPTYSVCSGHGYIRGERHECPTCGGPTEVYSRISGYYRPIKNWNSGKKSEFTERLVYEVRED